MKNYRFFQNNERLTDYVAIEKDIEAIMRRLSEQNIKGNEVVLCKSESIYGVFCQYLAHMRYGTIPVFFPYTYANDQISALEASLSRMLDVKSMLKFTNKGEIIAGRVVNNEEKIINMPLANGMVMFLTSATTGTPKVVVKTQAQLNHEVERYIKRLDITENDILLPAMTLDNAFGIGCCLLPSLKTGAAIADSGIINPKNIIQCSCRSKATIMMGSVFIHQKVLEMFPNYKLYEKMKFCIATGGTMIPGLQEKFYRNFKIPLLLQYGSSETGSLAVSDPGDGFQVVGRPLEGVEFTVRPDAEGFMVINVTTSATIGSYITENGLVNLPKYDYLTNDIGMIRKDGKLEVHGRKDDVVSISGLKISLRFVGDILKQFPGIIDVNLKVKEFAGINELQCDFTAEKEIREEELIQFCKEHLPIYQIPKRFRQVQQTQMEVVNERLKSWKNLGENSDQVQEIS
jgi:acyl-coenzyme A synthetase/AMP-(fatty) acid ligase